MQTNETFSLRRLFCEYKEVIVTNSRSRTLSETLTTLDSDNNVGENILGLTDSRRLILANDR